MASTSIPQRDFDVFLSFHGEDTRHNFVSHLHAALLGRGIRTFKDDRNLEVGDSIPDQLVKAMKTSWFAVVVLSKNYATSSWCLEELQQIMALYREDQIGVVPMFYKVEPSDVRHQTGSFEAAFQRYTDQEKIFKWKKALTQVGIITGMHFRICMDEATMIKDTVEIISSRLQTMKPTNLLNLDNVVGMNKHMEKIIMESEKEARVIGIWGMGGIGKTTLAKYLYDRFSGRFPARYFIEDIQKQFKDKSLWSLQERFLVSILGGQHIGFNSFEAGSQEIKARLHLRKVFIVLDGVDNAEQVHALVNEKNWFCPGSRVIITTRDRGLLNCCRVDTVHEVKCLDDEDALELFKKSAYIGRSPPTDGIKKLYIRASRLAHGLPSALVAYARYLSAYRTITEWEDELGMLETRPHKNVKDILKHSYDNLDEQDKTAFLHIACLLNEYPLSHVTSLLDNGRPRINHLKDKSLISISTGGCIDMHVLVLQTGREIVRQEAKYKPSKQRCLWDPQQIYDVLAYNRGTDVIEGVTLHMCEMLDKLPMSITVFNVMHSIRFLKFFQHLVEAESNVQLKDDRLYFPPNLKLLHWDAYPLKTLPSFRHHHLVELDLRYSKLERLWDGSVKLVNLRRLDVTGSEYLVEIPDLSTSKNFEELIAECCTRLRNIPKSLRILEKFTKLNAIHCGIRDVQFNVDLNMVRDSWKVQLNFLNEKVQLYYLTDLYIEGHINLKLGRISGHTDHIFLPGDTDGMSLSGYTEHISFSSSESLNIKRFRYREHEAPFNCRSFYRLPNLTELKLVNLNIQKIPDSIDHFQILEKLDLSGNDFEYLPKKMEKLPKLKCLSLHNCRKLKSLPQLTQVEMLLLSDCVNLELLLEEKTWARYGLLELWLDNCNNVQALSDQLGRFKELTYLDLSRNDFVTLPSTIRNMLSLGTLFLNNCKNLQSVEELPPNVKHLYAHGCDSLKNISLSPNHCITHLDLIHCPNLNLMNMDGISQEGSQQQCVCLTKPGAPSHIDDEVPGTWSWRRISLPLIWVTLVGNFFRFLISFFRRR